MTARPDHAAAMRAYHQANPGLRVQAVAAMRAGKRRGLDGLSEAEEREYQRLRQRQKNHGFRMTRAERLRAIGRPDLADLLEDA